MATLEERIQRLEDIKEIQALKIAYARAADDRYNADRLAALFTEDAVWDGGEKFGMHRGRQAIHDFFAPISETFTFALHYYMGPTIDIAPSGVAATGHWYMWFPATISERAIFGAATYDEQYRKVDGRWYFSHLKLTLHFFTPYESGWVKERFLVQ